jgi:adenylate kinase family enzyme
MQRILVIGGSGTGKSTLARAIGARLGLPVIHLDREFWSPGWVAPAPSAWRRKVEELAGREAWVMDGNYSATFDLRVPRADAIVWLDLPRWVYFPRTIKRLLANYGRQRPDIGEGCLERFDRDFFVNWVWTYPTRSRPGTLRLLGEIAASKPVIVLRRPRDVRAFAGGLPGTLSAAARGTEAADVT